jgi:hypothetical protein
METSVPQVTLKLLSLALPGYDVVQYNCSTVNKYLCAALVCEICAFFHPVKYFYVALFDSQGRMWIGATNLNGPMTWVNGKPLTYTSWASGQPASSKKKVVSMKCKKVYLLY